MAGRSELAVVLVLLGAAMGPAEAHPRVMLNTKASLLALKAKYAHSESAGTGRILREMSQAERAVASAMKGHPNQLRRVEGLLHAASGMARRAGASQSKAEHARQHLALLAEEEKALGGSAAGHAARSVSSAKAEAREEQRQLRNYAQGMAEVAAADRSILSATKVAEEQAALLLKGKAVSREVSQLLDVARAEERHVVASETHAAREARHQAALLTTAAHSQAHRRAEGASASSTGRIQQELEAAERRVAFLLRDRPSALHRVTGLLHAAARMARHAGVARTLQRRSHVRFALLAKRERAFQASSGASAAKEGHQRALLRYAAGMARVADVDRQIIEETKRAEERVRLALRGDAAVAAEVSQLLGAAQREEGRVVAMEARDAGEARNEAKQLEQQRWQHGPAGPQAPANEDKAALADDATDISEVSKRDQQIMFETDQAREEVQGVLRSGGADALTRKVAEAIDRAKAAEEKVVASEHRQMQEAREEIQHLQGRAAAGQQHAADAKRAALATASSATSRRMEARLQKVRQLLTEQVTFAARQAELADRSQVLADKLSAASAELVAGLRSDGDAVDVEVASGELSGRLADAQQMLQHISSAHKEMAVDAERKASALISYGRSLTAAGQRHRGHGEGEQLLQREGAGEVQAAVTNASQRALAQLRRGRRILAETAAVEEAVREKVRGPGVAKVRAYVAGMLQKAEHAEERAITAAKAELRHARHAAR